MNGMTERRQSPRYLTVFRSLITLIAAVILFTAVNVEAAEVNCDVSGDIPFTITNSFYQQEMVLPVPGTVGT